MKLLDTDYCADKSLNCLSVVVVLYCACEGSKQRFVPTGMAVRDNEVKRHRNFSKKHFSGVAACGFRLVGHDGGAVRDEAVPVYVTRFGDSAKRQILENGGLVPLFSEIKKFVLLEG